MLRTLSLAVPALFAACSSPPDAHVRTPENPPGPVTCTLPGIERAHAVDVVVPPAGCTFTQGGAPTAPLVLHSAAELEAAMTCSGPERPVIDWGTEDLIVVRYAMSPAFAGTELVDDGTTVTFGTRFRSPCPGDPMPMPMSATVAFTLPKGAERGFREATCSLPERCP